VKQAVKIRPDVFAEQHTSSSSGVCCLLLCVCTRRGIILILILSADIIILVPARLYVRESSRHYCRSNVPHIHRQNLNDHKACICTQLYTYNIVGSFSLLMGVSVFLLFTVAGRVTEFTRTCFFCAELCPLCCWAVYKQSQVAIILSRLPAPLISEPRLFALKHTARCQHQRRRLICKKLKCRKCCK